LRGAAEAGAVEAGVEEEVAGVTNCEW